jgi:hypothetical protein
MKYLGRDTDHRLNVSTAPRAELPCTRCRWLGAVDIPRFPFGGRSRRTGVRRIGMRCVRLSIRHGSLAGRAL